MKLCLDCNELVLQDCNSKHLIRKHYKEHHGGRESHLIDVDENLALVIQLLNRKGYSTRNCCAGHISREQNEYIKEKAYIQFQAEVRVPHIPDGFEWSELDEWPSASKGYDPSLPPDELQFEIWRTCAQLLRWAQELPPCARANGTD